MRKIHAQGAHVPHSCHLLGFKGGQNSLRGITVDLRV
jgi:hypothetical protein